MVMNLVPRAMPGDRLRGPLPILGFMALFAVTVYKAANYVIAGDMTSLAYVALLFIGSAFVVAMLNSWRKGLYFFLTWLLFEDFARKYLGNNMAIYFAKDVLALVVYLAFFLAYRRKQVTSFRPPFLLPVLLFVGYALLNSEQQLRQFFFVNMTLVIVIASLGIAQSVLGHTFLNPERHADDIRELSTNYRVSPISGLLSYRPTSVFVSTGRFANFLLVSLLLIVGFLGYLLLRHKKGRNLTFFALAIVSGAIVLGAARGVLLWSAGSVLVFALAFVWGAPWRQREVIRVLRTIQRAALGVALGLGLLFFVFPETLLSRVAFYQETLMPSSGPGALQQRTWNYPVMNFVGAFGYERWPYGYGIGTTSLGTQYVARFFGSKSPVTGVESGFGTLVIEMGIGGLLLWFIMSFAILFAAWRVVKKLRGSPWFPLAFVIFWYAGLLLLPMTFSGIQPYEDFVLNAYLWLLLGILFRLPTLAVSSQYTAAAQLPQTYSSRMR